MRHIFTILFLLIVFSGCDPQNFEPEYGKTYSPVYMSSENANKVAVVSPRPTTVSGKIYAFGNYLFQNDSGTGIHVIDNSDRKNPKKVSFIQIPFSTEVAVKGNFLYSNSFTDLVVFDISNAAAPVLAKRVAKIFPAPNQQFPPFTNVNFECPDSTKGVVTGWVESNIKNTKCRR